MGLDLLNEHSSKPGMEKHGRTFAYFYKYACWAAVNGGYESLDKWTRLESRNRNHDSGDSWEQVCRLLRV